MEQKRHQCAHQDENLHPMWTSRDHPAQDGCGHSALDQSKLSQEVRTTSCSEPMTLKAGQRKHVLGEIQKAIDHLEQSSTDGHDRDNGDNEVFKDHVVLQELFHLKLIGEVFSPDRFTQITQTWYAAWKGIRSSPGSSVSMPKTKTEMFGSCAQQFI